MHGKAEKIAVVLLTVMACLWLGAFPMASDLTYRHITHTKWVIALCLGGATALAGVTALTLRSISRKHLLAGGDWTNPARILAAGCFLWMGLSALFGVYAGSVNDEGQLTVLYGAKRYEGLYTQACYCAIFLGMSTGRGKLRPVVCASAVGAAAYCVVTAIQYTGANPLGFYPGELSIFTNYEFQSLLGNIDMDCGYLLMVVPLLFGGWMMMKTRWRHLLLPVAAACILALFLTEVQSGILGMAAIAFLLLMLCLRKPEYRARALIPAGIIVLCFAVKLMIRLPWLDSSTESICFTVSAKSVLVAAFGIVLMAAAIPLRQKAGRAVPAKWLAVGVAAALILALLAIALIPMESQDGVKAPNGLWELHEILNGRPQDSFGSWRVGCWRHTLEMSTSSAQSLFFGYGPDTFWFALSDHLDAEGAYLGENYDNPHNLYLTILVNNGLPAMLLFIAMLAVLIIRAVRRHTPESLTLAASVIAYAVQGMFCFSMCIVTPMFWAILGMLCAEEGKPASGDLLPMGS